MNLPEPIQCRRVVIRNYTPADLAFCTDIWSDPVNGRYLSDPDRAHVDEAYQQALDGLQDSADGYYFIVELRVDREQIGTCCAFPDKEGRVWDIGYCIRKDRWRQGFGMEVVERIVDWVREQGGSVITAEVAGENRASCALLEKCGFTAVKTTSFKKYNMDISFDSFIFEKKL